MIIGICFISVFACSNEKPGSVAATAEEQQQILNRILPLQMSKPYKPWTTAPDINLWSC